MKTRQQRSSIVTVAIMGVLVVGLASLCGYQYWTIATTTQQISAQRHKLASAKRQGVEQTKLLVTRQRLAQQIVQRRASWTWSDQLPLMVAQVARIAENHEIKIDTLQPQPMVARQALARFPLHMTMSTDLGRLTALLVEARAVAPVLSVDHLAIRTTETANAPLQVELVLSSFVQLDGGTQNGGHR